MVDSARAVEHLLYRYAELIDAGDLDGVAHLFTHGRVLGDETGAPGSTFEGPDQVRQMYAKAVRVYDDGTPKTRHVTTNAQIAVDEQAGTASARAVYTVFQATPDLPLQAIISGRYRDTFHRVDGAWWFHTRLMLVDLVGDLSHHLQGLHPR